MNIDRIEIKKDNFWETENKKYEALLGHIKLANPTCDVKSMLPKSRYTVGFTLKNTCSAFANGIRKTILDEIPIYSLDATNAEITTNDNYLSAGFDMLTKNIELIPISQNIPQEILNMSPKFAIEILNTSEKAIKIKSSHITPEKSQPADIIQQLSEIVPRTIPFIQLNPARHLKVSGITISAGVPKTDAGKYSPVANMRYYVDETQSSLASSSTLKNFRIEFTTYRTGDDPKFIMTRCCETLAKKIGEIQNELKLIEPQDTKKLTYFSTKLDIETKKMYVYMTIKDEAPYVADMISRYCYNLDENIPFVSSAVVHPTTEQGVIKIKHSDPINIIMNATRNLLADIAKVAQAF